MEVARFGTGSVQRAACTVTAYMIGCHSTVTSQSQHGHSTATAQPQHSHSTATAQHSHSTVTAQSHPLGQGMRVCGVLLWCGLRCVLRCVKGCKERFSLAILDVDHDGGTNNRGIDQRGPGLKT